MLTLTFVANLVVIQYAMGAAQSAVDRGARAGSALDGSLGSCQAETTRSLRGQGGLLSGSAGDAVRPSCHVAGLAMVARAECRFDWWLGPVPAVEFIVEGRSVIETRP
jgi:hypothetical protein